LTQQNGNIIKPEIGIMIIAIINTQWIIFAKLCSIALYSVTGCGYGVSVFGLEIIAAQFDLITKEAIPHNAQLAGFMHETHEINH
jgi:cytochrome b561